MISATGRLLRTRLWPFITDDPGQGLVEYGLILGLVAMVAIGALLTLGGSVTTTFSGAARDVGDANSTLGSGGARSPQ